MESKINAALFNPKLKKASDRIMVDENLKKNKSIPPARVTGYYCNGWEKVAKEFVNNFNYRYEVGASFCVYYKNKLVVDLWGGYSNLKRTKPFSKDTCCLLYSTSKGVCALVLALLIHRKLCKYDDKISKYWPEFAAHGKEDVTISQLVSHQVGLFGAHTGDDLTLELLYENGSRLSQFLAEQKPTFLPRSDGSKHAYCTVTLGLYLSQLVRRIDPEHRTLTEFIDTEFRKNLGLNISIGLQYKLYKPNEIAEIIQEPIQFPVNEEEADWIQHFVSGMKDPNSAFFKSIHPFGLLAHSEDLEKIESPSFNIYSNARSLASLANTFLYNENYCNKKLIHHFSSPCTHGEDMVLGLTNWFWSTGGFVPGRWFLPEDHPLRRSISQMKVFSHPGAAGAYIIGDILESLAIGYVPNRSLAHMNDYRRTHLLSAVYECAKEFNKSNLDDTIKLREIDEIVYLRKDFGGFDCFDEAKIEEIRRNIDNLKKKSQFSNEVEEEKVTQALQIPKIPQALQIPKIPQVSPIPENQIKDEKVEDKKYSIVHYSDGTAHLTFPKIGLKATNPMTAMELVRQLTHMGHLKTTIPMESIYNVLNILQAVSNVVTSLSKYRMRVLSNESISEADKIFTSCHHRYILQVLHGLGCKIPSDFSEEFTVPDLDEIIGLVENHFAKRIAEAHYLIKSGKYNIFSLSELFKPGTHVYMNAPRAGFCKIGFRVACSWYSTEKSLFGSTHLFHLALEYISNFGDAFSLINFEDVWPGHDEDKIYPLSSLHIIPMDDNLIQEFYERGLYYSKCIQSSAHYLAYSAGSFFIHSNLGNKNTKKVDQFYASASDGRIMVDIIKAFEVQCKPYSGIANADWALSSVFHKYKNQKVNEHSASPPSSDIVEIFTEIPKKLLHLCWPIVSGFSFTAKTWGHILINNLSPIKFDETAYSKLVLPPTHKELIEALVIQHSKSQFSSIIRGKGEGALLLFAGPPGTGKTLTCEALAELLKRPLYSISMGELGITPSELEYNLETILNLCTAWNALVLLDEADIFVEKRREGDILRNSMVGIILKLTEYYRGVIFFTSNRVKLFDPAFQSRITVALHYPPLSQESRAKIWKTLFKSSGMSQEIISSMDYNSLSTHDVNGRQIKSVIQLAIAVAYNRGQDMNTQLIKDILKVSLDFKTSEMEDF